VIQTTTNKNKSMGLATRSRRDGQLRPWAKSVSDPNNKRKFVFDLTRNLTGPPPILGGGPVSAWSPPCAGGITFKVAPLILTYTKDKRQMLTSLHQALKEI
jgi:hypothetical protein